MYNNKWIWIFQNNPLYVSSIYIFKCILYAPNIYETLSLKLPDTIYLKSQTDIRYQEFILVILLITCIILSKSFELSGLQLFHVRNGDKMYPCLSSWLDDGWTEGGWTPIMGFPVQPECSLALLGSQRTCTV